MKDADFSVELSRTDTKTQYETKIRKFADRLDDKISDAQDKVKDVKDEAKTEYQSRIDALKEKREEVAQHLVELKDILDDKWEDARDNFQLRFRTLSKEITDAYEGIVAGFAYLFKKLS
jgi:predicted  nucleic acid-binding Zn-ribbon protein